ncbi:MAG: outer membrane lipid asymmetry maintenance protein MlaD [Desulfobacterales bacterium]
MKRYAKETVVGIFMAAGILCIAYMAVKLGDVGLFAKDTYPLYARFKKVTGLRVGNPVQMVGLDVGRVAGFSLDQKDMVAVVELRIRNGITIYDDAIASIKTEGLIGDKYVEVDAGGAGEPLAPGETIFDTESPVDINEIISKYAFGDVQ